MPLAGQIKFRLLAARVKDNTRDTYLKAVKDFDDWFKATKAVADTNFQLDMQLWNYIGMQYELKQGAGRTKMAQLIAGIHLFAPQLRGKLPLSAGAVLGWKKLRPSVRHPPLTWSLTVAIAAQLAKWGRFDMAVGTLLAFASLLRVGEMVGLRVEDVLDAGSDDPRVDTCSRSGLRLRDTKTGTNKFAELLDANVRDLLRVLIKGKTKSSRVFNFAAATYRTWFKKACFSLGLSAKYVPHSLRHGGATALYMAGVPLETILVRGRWASTTSARHYIQSGESLLLAAEVPLEVRDIGRTVAASLVQAMLLLRRRCGKPVTASDGRRRSLVVQTSPLPVRHSARQDFLVRPDYGTLDAWEHRVLPS
jgi:integrase